MFENTPFDPSTSNFTWLVAQFIEIINILIAVVFAITLVVVVWNIMNLWILKRSDAYSAAEEKKTIFIGFIVLVVMSAVWGIVALLRSSII